MLKNESSLFKNKSPSFTKGNSHCSRAGNNLTGFGVGFLNGNSEGAMGRGKPGNGRKGLRRRIGLKEQGVL